MTSKIPVGRLLAAILGLALAVGAFVVLYTSFGGPGFARPGYELTAELADSKNLVVKSQVMIRGIRVGEVLSVDVDTSGAQVRFQIDDEFGPLPMGTKVRVGYRTIFAEAFVEVTPGPRGRPPLAKGARVPATAIIDPDEVLDLLDRPTRRAFTAANQEVARGLKAPDAPARVAAAIEGLSSTAREIRGVTDALRLQERDIGGLVTDAATVLRVTGRQEEELRQVVGSGRRVADILARNDGNIERTVAEFAGLAGDADAALTAARPALRDAVPIVRGLVEDVADLAPAIEQMVPVTEQARRIVDEVPSTSRVAEPLLRAAGVFSTALAPFAAELPTVFANAVPIAQYLGDRGPDLGRSFATLSDAVASGDGVGKWLRLMLVTNLDILNGFDGPCDARPDGLCVNPYPRPGDAADPQPYERGSYPRLLPFKP